MENLLIAIIAGFLGSYHCTGMCSPIVGLLPEKKASHLLMYNGGRIFTYTFLGFLAGYMGLSFSDLFREIKSIAGAFIVVAGLFMIILGIFILSGRRRTPAGLFYPIYEALGDAIQSMARKRGYLSPLFIGIFNGLLPCPIVYIFLFQAASTIDPLKGMLIMLSLGAGTLPAMLLSGSILKRLDIWKRGEITYLLAGVIIYLGIVSVVRGAMIIMAGPSS